MLCGPHVPVLSQLVSHFSLSLSLSLTKFIKCVEQQIMIRLGSKQLRKRVWSSIIIISGTIFPRYLLLFFNAMRDSEKSDKLATRLAILNDFFTYLLYCNISRSLFEKDKMLLSLLICTTLWKRFGKLAHEDFTFFATGGIWIGGDPPKNPISWIADKLWIEMLNLSTNKAFKVNKITTTRLMFWCKNMIGAWWAFQLPHLE